MAQLYDSGKVRSAAREVWAIRDELEQRAMELGRQAVISSEPLQGAAAEVMRERLQLMNKGIVQLGDELSSIGAALERYATVLEEVGEKLTQTML